jgi:hypothetical protein
LIDGTVDLSFLRALRAGWLLLATSAAVALPAPVQAAPAGRRTLPQLAPERSSGRRHAAAVKVPVWVHLATAAGDPVVSRFRVRAWLRRANAALAPYGIELVAQRVTRLPAGAAHLDTWRSSQRLAAYAPVDGRVHLFVLGDVDGTPLGRSILRAGKRVRGLHWRYRGVRRELRGRQYIVVTGHAPSTTLAHEVGHLFGLRHSTAEDNIMCGCRDAPRMRFTANQGERLRAGARAFLRGEPAGAAVRR